MLVVKLCVFFKCLYQNIEQNVFMYFFMNKKKLTKKQSIFGKVFKILLFNKDA